MAGNWEERLRRLSAAARRSAKLAADDRAARDAAIWEADQQGVGVRQIARWTGGGEDEPPMGTSQVHRIIVKETARRAEAVRDAIP